MFQTAKSLEMLCVLIKQELKLPPFTAISMHQAVGKLVQVRSIYDAIQARERVVAFVEQADGTEEIPENVTGVILAHDIPQLSHLAIRARQAKVLFVCFD